MENLTETLALCEEQLGYRFKNKSLLKQALTHSSCSATHLESNERLEFLGDAVLGLVVSHLLFRLFPGKREGELSQLKGMIVSRSSCRKISRRLGLGSFLFTGRGITNMPNSLVSNVMEAVIGAIYLDGGVEEARLFIEEKFMPEIQDHAGSSLADSVSPDLATENYKAELQTRIQRERSDLLPEYVLLEEQGPAHSKKFRIQVRIGDQLCPPAWGKSKKETEQRAARNALCVMEEKEPFYVDSPAAAITGRIELSQEDCENPAFGMPSDDDDE